MSLGQQLNEGLLGLLVLALAPISSCIRRVLTGPSLAIVSELFRFARVKLEEPMRTPSSLAQKIFRAFMRVSCICRRPFGSSTFPISPVGHRFPALKKSSFDAETVYHTFPKKRLFGKVAIPLDLAPGETNDGITPTTDVVTT
jgi:hypothetical protein